VDETISNLWPAKGKRKKGYNKRWSGEYWINCKDLVLLRDGGGELGVERRNGRAKIAYKLLTILARWEDSHMSRRRDINCGFPRGRYYGGSGGRFQLLRPGDGGP